MSVGRVFVGIAHQHSWRSRSALWVFLLLAALPFARAEQPHFTDEKQTVIRLLRLVEERLALMPGVAAYKWQHQAPIADPPREQRVIQEAQRLAAPLGLTAEGVGGWFDLQIRLARGRQAALHERWGAKGFDFAGAIPDLAADIRPKLDRLTHEQLHALYLAAPVLKDINAGDLRALTGEWSDSDRAELLQVLHGIRGMSSPALGRIAASGVVRIGTTGDYAPFTLDANGALAGSDIDMALQLAKTLNAQPVFVRTSWSSLLADLQAGKFDLAIGGISVTDERKAVANFSQPYVSGGKTILARCKDRRRYSSLAAVDRPKVRVIVNPGGTNEQYVRANVRTAQVRVHPDNRTIFEEIRARRADVMITDDAEVQLQTHRHKDLCRAMPGTLTRADKAILMPQDVALVAAVDGWLSQAIASGEPARLFEAHLTR